MRGESSDLNPEVKEEASDPDPSVTYLVGAATIVLISGGVHRAGSQRQ
jgi:hypothetical protein